VVDAAVQGDVDAEGQESHAASLSHGERGSRRRARVSAGPMLNGTALLLERASSPPTRGVERQSLAAKPRMALESLAESADGSGDASRTSQRAIEHRSSRRRPHCGQITGVCMPGLASLSLASPRWSLGGGSGPASQALYPVNRPARPIFRSPRRSPAGLLLPAVTLSVWGAAAGREQKSMRQNLLAEDGTCRAAAAEP
jgi:hypothetical protein